MSAKGSVLNALRRAGAEGVNVRDLPVDKPGTRVAQLRQDGHRIARDRIDGETYYTLEHDACVCERCDWTLAKPEKTHLCPVCREETALGIPVGGTLSYEKQAELEGVVA